MQGAWHNYRERNTKRKEHMAVLRIRRSHLPLANCDTTLPVKAPALTSCSTDTLFGVHSTWRRFNSDFSSVHRWLGYRLRRRQRRFCKLIANNSGWLSSFCTLTFYFIFTLNYFFSIHSVHHVSIRSDGTSFCLALLGLLFLLLINSVSVFLFLFSFSSFSLLLVPRDKERREKAGRRRNTPKWDKAVFERRKTNS